MWVHHSCPSTSPHSYPSTSPLIPLNVPTRTPQRPPTQLPYSYPSTPSLIPPTHTPHSDLLDSELIPLNVPPLIPLNFPTMYMYLCIAQTWYGVVQPSVSRKYIYSNSGVKRSQDKENVAPKASAKKGMYN